MNDVDGAGEAHGDVQRDRQPASRRLDGQAQQRSAILPWAEGGQLGARAKGVVRADHDASPVRRVGEALHLLRARAHRVGDQQSDSALHQRLDELEVDTLRHRDDREVDIEPELGAHGGAELGAEGMRAVGASPHEGDELDARVAREGARGVRAPSASEDCGPQLHPNGCGSGFRVSPAARAAAIRGLASLR